MPAQVPKSPTLTKRKVNHDSNSTEEKDETSYTEEQKQAVDKLVLLKD